MTIRNGITSLDMNVLLDELGEGKRKPQEAKASWGVKNEEGRQKTWEKEPDDVFAKIEKDYAESLKEEQKKEEKLLEDFGNYVTDRQSGGKIATPGNSYGSRQGYYQNSSNEYLDRYNAGEEYLMSGGKNAAENTVKGVVNRARSTVGESVEDLAYLINDYASWYAPAQTVLKNNTAGTISEKADEQFNLAKNTTGNIGDGFIDFADNTAEMLGYSVLGPKALTYVFGSSEGLEEYRKQRENGVSQDLAMKRALAKAAYSVASEKVEDYVGDFVIGKELSAKFSRKGEKQQKSAPLQNSAGYYIIEKDKADVFDEPNSIVQIKSDKGGLSRNFYDENGKQFKQISNNGHGHSNEEKFGKHGEHAHDYKINEFGRPEHQKARELTYLERKENDDFL